jgi:hypothetical protein
VNGSSSVDDAGKPALTAIGVCHNEGLVGCQLLSGAVERPGIVCEFHAVAPNGCDHGSTGGDSN